MIETVKMEKGQKNLAIKNMRYDDLFVLKISFCGWRVGDKHVGASNTF